MATTTENRPRTAAATRAATGGPNEADHAPASATRRPPEILEDRWAGLLHRQDATKLQIRLDKVLCDLADDLTRRDVYGESAVIDGEVVRLDVVMDIDGLQDVIRDWMLERAAKVAVR